MVKHTVPAILVRYAWGEARQKRGPELSEPDATAKANP